MSTFDAVLVSNILRRLTAKCESFVLYKHGLDAIAGRGDADCYLDPKELEVATAELSRAAFERGLAVWFLRYKPWAVTFFTVSSPDQGSARLLAEIDINTRPTVAFANWRPSASPNECVSIDGVRAADEVGEAFAAVMYHHLRRPPGHVPRREWRSLNCLNEEQQARLIEKINQCFHKPAAFLLEKWLRQNRLGSGSGSRHLSRFAEWQDGALRRIARVVLSIGGMSADPGHAFRSLHWRLSLRNRRVQKFAGPFIHRGHRSIEALGGYHAFQALIKGAGGRQL